MPNQPLTFAPNATRNRPEDLVFLPLGGTGEIGMNLNLYGFGGKWLMVDLGMSFPDETMPGLDVIMADPGFIAERREDLVGLVVTHAHEDHIGAIGHLWPRLQCPIYATPFTASVLRMKLAEAGLLQSVPLREVALGGRVKLAPFDIEFVSLTHSIPEPNGLAIRTAAGTVFHTGDWKFDPEPVIGGTADTAALTRLGDEGVVAMIGDSTNVLRPGEAGSEADVERSLVELIGRYDRRVAIACFASNIARLRAAAVAAEAHGRHAALVGRSLWRMEQAARENGYLDGIGEFLTPEAAAELPPERVLLVCTGSQGEPRSALSRIAADDHPLISLDKGDTVIFSSRIIPGNERAIGRIHNRLSGRGIQVVTEHDHFVHVSGHPARDEVARMYRFIRPAISVPVHGESRHLIAHARLAEECGVGQQLIIEDGDMVRLAPGPAEVIDKVETGRLGLDGKALVALDDEGLKERLRMTFAGAAVATVVIDRSGEVPVPPQVSLQGVVGEEPDLRERLAAAAEKAVTAMPRAARSNDDVVREAVRLAIRRGVSNALGKKPVTDVHIVRI